MKRSLSTLAVVPQHHPCPENQELFFNVRRLLKSGKLHSATHFLLRAINQHRSQPLSAPPSLWRTAGLFNTFDHHQTAAHVFGILRDQFPSQRFLSATALLQACDRLVWRLDPNERHAAHRQHHLHRQLSQALNCLTTTQGHSFPLHRPRPLNNEHTENERSLEIILSVILKLGDADWLVKTLREFYPHFTHWLGQRLYGSQVPPDPGPSAMPVEPLNLGDLDLHCIPPGRLLKYLVSIFTRCGQFHRAFRVVEVHGSILASSNDFSDLSPHITFLKDLATTFATSPSKNDAKLGRGRREKMLIKVLEFLLSNSEHIELDSFKFEGLIDMRYRSRRTYRNLLRKNASCFNLIHTSLTNQIRLYLLHHRHIHPLPSELNDVSSELVKFQQPTMGWKYRMSARCFTTLLLSLRSKLRTEARRCFLHACAPSELSDNVAPARIKRPSPGSHRRLFGQIFALQALNCSIMLPSGQSVAGLWSWIQNLPNLDFVPVHFKILSRINIQLLLEIFWLAQDYAGLSILIFKLLKIESGSVDQALVDFLSLHLDRAPAMECYPSSGKIDVAVELRQGRAHLHDLVERWLRSFELHRSDQWWSNELKHVINHVNAQHRQIFNSTQQPRLSEATLQFLRRHFAQEQLQYLCYGFPFD